MEEFEDLVPQPDEDGRMELTYRAWIEVDDVVFTMARTLIYLDISFNSITFIPEELGDLYQLKLFNCSCNQIDALPNTLGRLIKLQTLKANGNHIKIIPNTIGKCKSIKVRYIFGGERIGWGGVGETFCPVPPKPSQIGYGSTNYAGFGGVWHSH